MDFVVSNFDKFVAKYSVMDNIFGIAITCLIIGLFLLLYYRKIESYLFKPFKVLLQFCANAFLIVGLMGVLIEGGFHIVNKFSGKSPQSDNSSSNIVSEVKSNHNTKSETQKQTSNNETISKTEIANKFSGKSPQSDNSSSNIVSEVQNNYNTNNKTQKQTSNNQTISEAEYEKIIKLPLNDIIALANDGNVLAQYRLGFMYYFYGIHVNEDEQKEYEQKANEWYKKAFEGFSKAAELGNAYAQYWLGAMYQGGDYVNKDYKKAFEWFSKAAELGNAYAQYRLGTMYYFGEYVNKDYKKAFEWFSKAAEQGNAYAQHNLGAMYAKGIYVNRDYKKAYMWYYLCQLFGRDSSTELNELTKSGWFSSAKVSQSEVQEARAEAQRKYDEIIKRMNK